ncbi:MAG: YggS family pyridoxal phosphate-dependent enzyme [Ilumatobacteraceae bacterium]
MTPDEPDRERRAMPDIGAALAVVRARIRSAGGGDGVSILPVTKSFGSEAIEAVRAAGGRAIGENYAQELLAKRSSCQGLEVHFIGRLQSNKVRQLAGLVAVYESVDRARLADEIARRDPGASVMLQVDTSGEPGKGGCAIEDLDDLVRHVRRLPLLLVGLMTVGPTVGGPEAARAGFRTVRAAASQYGLEQCSMGMTADLEVAVEEGSTQIRVGSALFGERPVTDRTPREG